MIFDTFLQLPIFQGMSIEQLTAVLEKTPFEFRKFAEGEVIAEAGEQRDSIVFILSGIVRKEMPTFDGRIIISEDFEGPHTLPFYYLFGAQTTSPSRLLAQSSVGIMELAKPYLLQLLRDNEIPLVNVLNMLSTHAQKQHKAMDFVGKENDLERLASWLLAYTDRHGRNIQLTASESTWCQMLHLQPNDFWRIVAGLEGKKIVEVDGLNLKLLDRYALRGIVNSK